MIINWTAIRISTLLTSLAILPLTALADVGPGNPPSDPPSRVAELNYFSGNVTVEPAGTTNWSYVQLNRPLTTGDQLWDDQGGRAELYVGSTALHIGQQTALDIVNLDDRRMQLKVTQGRFSAHLRVLPPNQQVEIDTPNVALQANSAGLFRVDVAPDGSTTTVTVRTGEVTVYGDNSSLQMTAGQQISFVGTGLQQQAGGSAPEPDSFDLWVARRDHIADDSNSAQYVSREIPGYQNLDANGSWRDDPAYGAVWVPTIAVTADWAPYRDGHWAWIAPWGWTWIDNEPWGFAPFHYGRWANMEGTWGWVPGPLMVAAPPVYAPALVAFVGGGGNGFSWGINLSLGGGINTGVAWFPLGPGEAWQPAYGYSPNYYNRLNNFNSMNNTNIHNTNIHNTTFINNVNNSNNVTNIANIHNTYINQQVPGAVTAVPANIFVRGQSVAPAALPLTMQQIRQARIGASAPAIAPVRASFTGDMHPAAIGQPAMLAQRQVIATRPPVLPPAYHDTLAQRFANQGGRVMGAGEPVVRSIAPATLATETRRTGMSNALPQQDFHVINKKLAQANPVTPNLITPRNGQTLPADGYNRHPDQNNFNPARVPAEQQYHPAPQATSQLPQRNLNNAPAYQGPHVPAEQQYHPAPQANSQVPQQNRYDNAQQNRNRSESDQRSYHEAVYPQRQSLPQNVAQHPQPAAQSYPKQRAANQPKDTHN